MAQENTSDKNNGAQTASQLPLFYKNPVPIDAKKHTELSLKKDFGFGFTQGVNAVPVNMIEMTQTCHFYPIAFSPDENATPVAILGLRDGENLFLDQNNIWQQDVYIPAYVRRYPFIFSEIPDSDQLTLCIDQTDDVVEEGGEQKFFDSEGKPTALAQNALEFCKSYHAAAQATQAFGKALLEKDLLTEKEVQISISGNRRINFSGFKILDEKKFAALDNETFIDWREKGWLPFIYAHLFSGSQWQRLSIILNERMNKEAA